MNKKIILVLLALFMAMGSISAFSVPVYAEKDMVWQDAYAKFLRGPEGFYEIFYPTNRVSESDKFKDYIQQKPYFYFSLRDIDNNGIPELIVRWDQSAAGHSAEVYTYSNGIQHLGHYMEAGGVNSTSISDNPKYPGLFYFAGRYTYEIDFYTTIKDNKLVEETIFESQNDIITVNKPSLVAESAKTKVIPDYKLTEKNIIDAIYNYGKNLGSHPHPYALALINYLEEVEHRTDDYNVGVTTAYLEDINGDGTKEMLISRNEYFGERLYYFHNGKLHSYDIETDFPDDGMHFTKNKYLVILPNHGDGILVTVLKIEEGKISKETEFMAIDFPYIRYTQDDRVISESEYKNLMEKYGIDDRYKMRRENQINEIFEMTNIVKATTTDSKVQVNGKYIEFEAYNINNNNYFKLRDLAQVVNGIEKNFEVEWDGAKNAINLVSNTPYTPVGGELNKGDGKAKTATPTTSIIYKDRKEVELTAYNINGNNFFKLRDIAKAFDIGVTWNGKTSTIEIDTSIGYVEE